MDPKRPDLKRTALRATIRDFVPSEVRERGGTFRPADCDEAQYGNFGRFRAVGVDVALVAEQIKGRPEFGPIRDFSERSRKRVAPVAGKHIRTGGAAIRLKVHRKAMLMIRVPMIEREVSW